MNMEWKEEKESSAIVSGYFRVEKHREAFRLKCGWSYIGTFPSEAGAKRVAECIYRELFQETKGENHDCRN